MSKSKARPLRPRKQKPPRRKVAAQSAADSTAPVSKRITYPLTNDERAAIATRWLEPLRAGKPAVSKKKLKDEFSARFQRELDHRTINAAIQYAFRNRLVEVIEGNALPRSWRMRDLERALVNQWPIGSAIVVGTDDNVTNSSTIHHQLGKQLAESIEDAHDSYFPDGAIVGIGSGRAIHYLITSFEPVLKFNVSNITLMSLTGSIYPEAPIRDPRDLVDADANTVLFANCFGQRTHVRTIAFPLAHKDVSLARRNTFLHDPAHPDDARSGAPALTSKERNDYAGNEYNEHIPTHAFVGVGILGPNHRLYHEARGDTARDGAKSTMLQPIRAQLKDLVDLSEMITRRSSQEYYPCADICNRFFFVEPPSGVKISERERGDLESWIHHINSHVLTVTKTQLSKVKKIILIAGTSEKYFAIRSLLERERDSKLQLLRFSVLCTDAKTARRLVA